MEYTIRSSHGKLIANIHGEIVGHKIEDKDSIDGKKLAGIFKVDFAEWCKYWRKPMPSEFDILDLGYMCRKIVDGIIGDVEIAEPDHTWRKDIAQELLKHKKAPPPGMQMRERLDHARAAVDAYMRAKGEHVALRDDDYEDTDVADLIADLLHFQISLGYNVDATLARAQYHHAAEQADEHNGEEM